MQHPAPSDANELITAVRMGQSGVIESLYDTFRSEFLAWAGKRFKTTPGDIEDAWQEAVVIFYEQVKSRKLQTLDCSPKTYLFAIGCKWLLKNHRKMKWFLWKDEIDEALRTSPQILALDVEEDIWEDERALLEEAMNQLTPRCQELLVQRYYLERSIPEMMEALQYGSVNSVSVVLSNCLKGLKKIIEEKTRK